MPFCCRTPETSLAHLEGELHRNFLLLSCSELSYHYAWQYYYSTRILCIFVRPWIVSNIDATLASCCAFHALSFAEDVDSDRHALQGLCLHLRQLRRGEFLFWHSQNEKTLFLVIILEIARQAWLLSHLLLHLSAPSFDCSDCLQDDFMYNEKFRGNAMDNVFVKYVFKKIW